jgi:hypothetical protein
LPNGCAAFEENKIQGDLTMNTYTINEYLLELMQEASRELLKIYFNKPNRRTLLKFPQDRKLNKRISEQELRFVLTNLHGQFSHPELYYSVETPTLEEYSFSKKGKRSAASDLSFYHNDEKVLNIELKALIPEQKAIDKDIEKLVSENCNGAWIHVLKNEDSGTVKKLFEKFENAFHRFNYSKKPISFHILILETQTLLSRKGKEKENDYSNNIFNINYSLWRNLKQGKYQYLNGTPTTEVNPDVDWQIDKFDINNEI